LWLPAQPANQDSRIALRQNIGEVPLQVMHLLDCYFDMDAIRTRIKGVSDSIIRQLCKEGVIERSGPNPVVGQTHLMLNQQYLN
jgi:hypothetical protein